MDFQEFLEEQILAGNLPLTVNAESRDGEIVMITRGADGEVIEWEVIDDVIEQVSEPVRKETSP